ncbi:uncharacterized protein BO95DRAFT_429989 [Aspergillus brunneoviolaceus CBS 621.78]|uniref:Uncharacterized protein n=1 Tax=Aspergillus brunneoviolaceus CBS 621.78 TaxID=1450534 RepID=A0ACD1GFB9_9EURO|nr:hypothetical protein BO95DRAFT_429989 [Aspergillus brunneoviolaceus CBS 621.78]RAH47953.1 hypothetical protein BO95DRAFT_429989 [Aspergillus brunneoviolaceus CBS 621.78]
MSDEEMNKGKPPSPDAPGDHSSSNFISWWGTGDLGWLLGTGGNAASLDRIQELKRQTLLLTHGDYAGRLWNCLVEVSKRRDMRRLPYRVAQFRDKLIQESSDPSGRQPHIEQLEECVRHLQRQSFDVDLGMAKLAILVYSRRNEVCHAAVGKPDVSKDLAKLWQVIDHDKEHLPEALPDDQLLYHTTWQRILTFYGSSQSWINLKPGTRFARPLPEPDFRLRPDKASRVRAFDNRECGDRVDAVFQTFKERIPVTSRPVSSQTRARHSVSDPTPYILPRKRRASGSPDSEGGGLGSTAAERLPTVAFGNDVDTRQFQAFYEDLRTLYDKDPERGRKALEGARRVVTREIANHDDPRPAKRRKGRE